MKLYKTDGSVEDLPIKHYSLAELQAMVGGNIECGYWLESQVLVYNEEGVLKGLPQNPFFPHKKNYTGLRGNVLEMDRDEYHIVMESEEE